MRVDCQVFELFLKRCFSITDRSLRTLEQRRDVHRRQATRMGADVTAVRVAIDADGAARQSLLARAAYCAAQRDYVTCLLDCQAAKAAQLDELEARVDAALAARCRRAHRRRRADLVDRWRHIDAALRPGQPSSAPALPPLDDDVNDDDDAESKQRAPLVPSTETMNIVVTTQSLSAATNPSPPPPLADK